jgi:hypothetical protein
MKNLILGWLSIAVVLSLFICAPLPVLACGGGGGGGGGGEAGLGGPQSSTAGRPTTATFSKPTGSSFGRPGAAGYIGGINMGTPATVTAGFGGMSLGVDVQKVNERIEEEAKMKARETPEMTIARQDKQYYDDLEQNLAVGETICVVADKAGSVAQVGLSFYTWAISVPYTMTQILLAGARGAAKGRDYADKKGESEIQQAVLSGLTLATTEAHLSFNPFASVPAGELADFLLHSEVQNLAPQPVLSSGYADTIIEPGRAREEVKELDHELKDLKSFYEDNKNTMTRDQKALLEKHLKELEDNKRAAQRKM